jgi:D-alanyl-D-alanine carboxypeptidase/D-alanyl-D-alanine-endopeptidase (penicillin-binding protein 4)
VKSSGSYKRRSRRSRGIKRRVILGAILIVAIVAGAWGVLRLRFGLASAKAVAVASPLPTLAPPAPTAPWTPSQRARLQTALRDAFGAPLAGADRYSLAVLDAAGAPVFLDRADRAVTPASTQKLLIAATALHDLGAGFRFHTIFAATALPAGGTLPGDLWMAGSGDPSLRSSDLRAGVARLLSVGINRIEGGVSIDTGALLGAEINPNWDPEDAGEDFQAPVSAVSIDGDTLEFDVRGVRAGEPASVSLVPDSDAVSVSGEIETTSDDDSVTIAPGAIANTFTIHGTIPEGTIEKFWLPVHGMPAYAGAVLDRLLRDAGIATGGPAAISAAPFYSIALWDHASQPLRPLERHMLFHSDNHYAEQLLRTVGGEAEGLPADAGGIAAVRSFLAANGIPAPGLHLLDGSGLAAGNRVSALTLAGVLSAAERSPGGESLYPLLPGGRQGTLKYYGFTTALGRVRAKSGHIGGVSALAGYVDTMHHGRVVFAFAINGAPGDPDAAIVRAVDRLATF